jgi:dihydroflavonol-4-reductase
MGQMLLKLYSGKLPFLVPGGYDWVDVRDVAEASANAVTRGCNGESYILSGEWHSLKEIAEVMTQGTGKKIKNIVLPYWMAYTGVPFIKMWSALTRQKPLYTKESLDIIRLANKNIRNEKARKELGYSPRPFSETISDTISWFKENKYI